MKCKATLLALVLCFATVANADDLFKVKIYDADDAHRLRAIGVDPVVSLTDGYLVLADGAVAERLHAAGLEHTLIARDITIDRLALDGRMDRKNVEDFPLIFEEDNLRLFLVDFDELAMLPEQPQLYPVTAGKPTIEYNESPQLVDITSAQAVDLDSLIAKVERDSLESHLERLQAFYRRYTGTDSVYAARDWIAAKFTSFGYDSVVIDSFQIDLGGPTECQNVIAYKIGATWPNQQIVVGAHYDAVSSSPGADDNGTGTSGVLEIARILKDVETEMTFIFILFAAEEQGLHGSWHYADEAAARGDSIIYMLNLDMIGHYENGTQAELYHGPDVTFSQLWQTIASSYVGIQGILAGNTSGSDHYPFSQRGYDVTFVAEYIFSNVYHSYRDSTTYVDYAYMTKMVQASLATVYQVNVSAAPQPSVAFIYPGGVPSVLEPNVAETFEVEITGAWGGSVVPGSAQLHHSTDGGGFVPATLIEIATDLYGVTLPAIGCDSYLEFYLSAEETENGLFTDPDPAEPNIAIVATEITPIFADNFQTNTGWTVDGDASDGQWGRGIPAGGGLRGDPPSDFDASGQCYLTDNVEGNSDVDGGTTNLYSPTFDLSPGDARIHYARWYSNNFGADPFNDVFVVSISNDDGQNWTLVETVGPAEEASGGWLEYSFWVADIVTPTAQMKLRFAASDLAGGSVIEAAVDDFTVTFYECVGCDCGVWGDLNGDGEVDPLDVSFLVSYVYLGLDARQQLPDCPYEAGDVDCNDGVDPIDVTFVVNLVYLERGPFPCVPCSP